MADADLALAAGFDYVELPAQQIIGHEADYIRLSALATNLFFPSHIRLFGPEATPYREYAQEVIEAAGRVGVKVMVIGSGAARRRPDGMEAAEAESAFVRVAAELSEIAEPLGISIAPESLNRGETNVGNDLRALATQLQVVGVGYTADSYHVLSEWTFEGNEGPPSAEHWRDQIPYLPTHVHLGDRHRHDPAPTDPDLVGFAHRLRELGYDEGVSLECRRRDGQSLAQALADTRSLFALSS
jgi:sugar phosphate isomerase/epimerase